MAARLSVVVIVGERRRRGERCLAALLKQTAIDSLELIVVDIAPDRQRLAGEDHAAVRLCHRPAISSYESGRAEGARLATTELIAFVEDHVVPAPGWAAAVLEAFERPVSVVNYSFANLNPATHISRASLMAEYGPWMAPARSGPIRFSACHNLAYRKQVLPLAAKDLAGVLEAEFLLHRRILRAGGVIWLAGEATVAHENWTNLPDMLRANRALKRLLAARRASLGNWSFARRLLYAPAMVLTPALHFWRLVRTLFLRPALWPLFLKSFPATAATYVAGAASEAAGYLFGAGNSATTRDDSELRVVRDE